MAQISEYYLSAAIADQTGYRTEKDNIPFYIPEDGTIKVKTLFNKFENVALTSAATTRNIRAPENS